MKKRRPTLRSNELGDLFMVSVITHLEPSAGGSRDHDGIPPFQGLLVDGDPPSYIGINLDEQGMDGSFLPFA